MYRYYAVGVVVSLPIFVWLNGKNKVILIVFDALLLITNEIAVLFCSQLTWKHQEISRPDGQRSSPCSRTLD
jgi:hypothetical protein